MSSAERVAKGIKETLGWMDGHILEFVVSTDDVTIVRMRSPGTRNMLVQITFTPEGIAIQGDLVPGGGNGVCSRYGYGLGWFTGSLSPGYLAEKFLQREWCPLQTEDHWRDLLAEASRAVGDGDYGAADRVVALRELIRYKSFDNAGDLVALLGDLGLEYTAEDLRSYYPEGEVITLAAIQQKFAELFSQFDAHAKCK